MDSNFISGLTKNYTIIPNQQAQTYKPERKKNYEKFH
jgi:hypothetical protein